MRRFVIVAPGCAGEDLNAWEDAGFKLVETTDVNDPELRPDVIMCCPSRENDIPWNLIRSLLPKLFILAGSNGLKPAIPGDLSEMFSLQMIAGENVCFTIGSSIQGRVAAPDWESYRESSGPITRKEQIKAFAGSVYRFLLQDVFRETAEWCGHMSSVVGPM